jgi:hypothetical protein
MKGESQPAYEPIVRLGARAQLHWGRFHLAMLAQFHEIDAASLDLDRISYKDVSAAMPGASSLDVKQASRFLLDSNDGRAWDGKSFLSPDDLVAMMKGRGS